MEPKASHQHRKRRKLTIPTLPDELITAILERLLVKYLLQFKCAYVPGMSYCGSTKFANGRLHWVTTGGGDGYGIMSIDLVDEKWVSVELPPCYKEGDLKFGGLGVLGHNLSVLCEILLVFESALAIYNPKHESMTYPQVTNVDDSIHAELCIESLVCPISENEHLSDSDEYSDE
ncbi:hypothetical protein FXO38_36293 [Capsicum annuum]|nr:hypothetical protein FXO38_36293 [Capsicum annuum]